MKRRTKKLLSLICAAAMLAAVPVPALADQLTPVSETEVLIETDDIATEETVSETAETETEAESETIRESETAAESETTAETEEIRAAESESETTLPEETEEESFAEPEDTLLYASMITDNLNANNYTYNRWYYPVNSYLTETGSGFMRVEYMDNNGKILIEQLDSNGNFISSSQMSCELRLFGGFFAGSNAYYLVFGDTNYSEDNDKEVLRVVKYNKSWQRLKAYSAYGINTIAPFEAGSVDMAEDNGILYVHTCHEMYTSSDGLNHQANMTFALRESDMSLTSCCYGVMNKTRGYCSHSFNQLIRVKDGTVYRLDHGDAYPRGLLLTGFTSGNSVTDVDFCPTLTEFPGSSGANYTGVSMGGLEISGTHALAAFNEDVSYGNAYYREIKVAAYNLNSESTEIIRITKSAASGEATNYTPKLVKVSDDLFLLMWAEYDGYEIRCMIVQLDGTGHPISEIIPTEMQMSDCQPILARDGSVVWYVTDGYEYHFYRYKTWDNSPLSVTLNKKTARMEKGTTLQLKASVLPSNASDKTVKWTSSDKSVVTVSNGKVTAVGSGQATITAKTVNGRTATCQITVVVTPTGVKLSATSMTAYIHCYKNLKATVIPEDATDKSLTWTSSDTNIVTVDKTGRIYGNGLGTATVTVKTANGKTAFCKITVKKPTMSISLDKTEMDIYLSERKELKATVLPEGAADRSVTWTSSDESVATVDQYGRVSPQKLGTTIITAKTNVDGKKATCKVTVYAWATSMDLDKYRLSMSVGETQTLKATIKPEEGTNKKVVWTSANEKVARVSSTGKVTAVSAGKTTVRCASEKGGVWAECSVEVVGGKVWKRLYGTGRYDTMQAIVQEGFQEQTEIAVLATGESFKDALAAAGLAGLHNCPVILTNGKYLSRQAWDELYRLAPQMVYVAGGPAAVSDDVMYDIYAGSGGWIIPGRLAGNTSSETSAALAMEGKGSWSDTAIIATNKTFKDALSAAPLSYALHMPILLSDNGKSLNAKVTDALKKCGIKKAIIAGGELAVTENVETQLRKAGVSSIRRIGGRTAVETSKAIAEYGISRGMTANRMGVATSQNFPDALAGAALCGVNNSVLVLADDKATYNYSFPKAYKSKIHRAYIFGGTYAVGTKTANALEAAVK